MLTILRLSITGQTRTSTVEFALIASLTSIAIFASLAVLWVDLAVMFESASGAFRS